MQIFRRQESRIKQTNQKELYLMAFGLSFIAACALFIPYMIKDAGYFLFYGDFNVQQIPFYKMCHDAVRSGDIFWNWNTDLGVNFISSYSFYLLGSPFFWLTIPFPSWMVPYLMGPLLILKFSLASLTAYVYLRRFVKPQNAVIGGLLYAFSGFSIYNIFFNHFHEAIIIFPILLYALELYMEENKKGVFALAVFAAAFMNYFFFAGMVVFVMIYWLLRMLSGKWSITIPRFGWLMFEAVIGVALAAVLLLPSFLTVIANPRTSSSLIGWDNVLYGKNQIFLNAIEVFFFPPDLPARPVFFTGSDVKWSSLAAWLPVFSMTGAIGFMCAKKGHWLKRIIIILFLMALVPGLNSLFYMANSAYYARWYYMLVLMIVLATVISFEDKEVNWWQGLKWTAGITAAFILVIGFLPAKTDGNGKVTQWGLYDHQFTSRFWITCAIAVISLVILALLITMMRKPKEAKNFFRTTVFVVMAVSVIYSSYFVAGGKTHSNKSSEVINNYIRGADKISLPDSGVVRTDFYNCMDNAGMFLEVPTINAFHSVVPVSIMNFYEYVGVTRDVASRPEYDDEALRSLLSVKWMFDFDGDSDKFASSKGTTKMKGYNYYATQNNFDIYENTNFIPFGFAYDTYVDKSTADSVDEKDRAHLMLKALVLDNEQIARHSDILTNITDTLVDESVDSTQMAEDGTAPVEPPSVEKSLDFSYDALVEDVKERNLQCSSYFAYDNRGFDCKITLDSEQLVFFSVPYEDGWSATVDGQAVDIEQVNVGFMAVRVGAGEHTIRFNYMTPGLAMGAFISLGAAAALIIYVILWKVYSRDNMEVFERERRAQSIKVFDDDKPKNGFSVNLSLEGDAQPDTTLVSDGSGTLHEEGGAGCLQESGNNAEQSIDADSSLKGNNTDAGDYIPDGTVLIQGQTEPYNQSGANLNAGADLEDKYSGIYGKTQGKNNGNADNSGSGQTDDLTIKENLGSDSGNNTIDENSERTETEK